MRTRAIIGLMALSAATHAQLVTLNGANVQESGADVMIDGSLLAGAASSVANQGIITLTGDLLNNSGGPLFASVAGEVVMRGVAQSVGGTSDTHFDELTLSCSSLTLNRDASVGGTYPSPSGQLKLGDAPLLLNSHRLTVTNPATTAISRISGRIVSETDPLAGYGEVEWRIGPATGAHAIPFGTLTAYLPLVIDIVAAGTGSGAFIAATYPTDPFAFPNNRPLASGLPSLTDINGSENAPNVVDRFWPLATTGYSSAPTTALTFTYRDSEWNTGTNVIAEASLQAQRFSGAQWSPPAGAVDPAANTVTTPPINEHGIVWALASAMSPLPVELLRFDAAQTGHDVLCTWSTASELGSREFIVQRSADAEHFEEIGTVLAAGNSIALNEYAFVDHHPLQGLSYYRLKQIDLDGSNMLSATVPVYINSSAAANGVRVFPNPCDEELFIEAIGEALESTSIRDATGREVLNVMLHGPGIGRIDAGGLAPGQYSISLGSQSRQRTARFIKR
jgi:hypothetical protein